MMDNEPPSTPESAEQPPALPTGQKSSGLYQPPSAQPAAPKQAHASMGDSAGVRMLLPVGRSGWAIAAGYLGLFSMTVIMAPLALIISTVAIWDIQQSKGSAKPKHGMGRAIFGLVMGLLGTCALAFLYANVTRY